RRPARPGPFAARSAPAAPPSAARWWRPAGPGRAKGRSSGRPASVDPHHSSLSPLVATGPPRVVARLGGGAAVGPVGVFGRSAPVERCPNSGAQVERGPPLAGARRHARPEPGDEPVGVLLAELVGPRRDARSE